MCGNQVFFYQSRFGGRVFFDDLGPPWPKHPCTDSSNASHDITTGNDYPRPDLTKLKNHTPKWVEAGWDPVILQKYSEEQEIALVKLKRFYNDDELILGINADVFWISNFSPIFIQEHPTYLGMFKISYLDIISGKSCEDFGYRDAKSLADIQNWKEATAGAPLCQNKVALSLLFRLEENKITANLKDKNIDFDAVDFWFAKAATGGNANAAFNRNHIQKTRLKEKFGNEELVLLRNDLKDED